MLQTHDQPYLAVEHNVDAVVAARRDGYRAIFGDITKLQTLHRLNLDTAKALVLTMNDPVLAARTVKRIRVRASCN
jgi:CPA2 family monovalent cation:H+ antiporter-2